MSEYTGLYRGAVHDINDPESRGRLRILVPDALGSAPSGWAEPVLPTKSQPVWVVGDRIWVQFEAGDINRPVYMSRMAVGVGDLSDGFVDDLELLPGFDAQQLAQEALDAANNALDFAETRNRIFRQETEPDPVTQGPFTENDLWLDEDDQDRMRRWDPVAGVWGELLTHQAAFDAQQLAQEALDAAGDALDFAETRNRTFRQETEPDPVTDGPFTENDSWFDGSRFRHWDVTLGTWVEVRDDGAVLAEQEIPNIHVDVTDLWTAHGTQQENLNNILLEQTNINDAMTALDLQQDALAIDLDANDQALNELNTVTLPALNTSLEAAADDIVATNQRLNPGGDVAQSIYDASVSPVTNERLTPGTLTVWPFAQNTIPSGTIGGSDIADFSVIARKLNTSQHVIY